MKEIIIYGLVIVVFFLFTARTTITFEPFSIKFERLWLAVGYVMIFLGAICIQIQGEMEKNKIIEDKEIFFDFERDKTN